MFAGIPYWLIFGVFVALSVIRLVFGGVGVMKRAGNMAAAAQDLGLTFIPWTNDPNTVPKVGTELFRQNSLSGFRNVMAGNYGGLEIQVFDYAYSSGSAQNSRTTSQTVAVYTQSVDLPFFSLQPANIALKILHSLEHQNVDLDYPPGSTHHYAVHGPDAPSIRALFTAGLISFVEGLDRSKGWHIEGAGKMLVLYRYNRRVQPERLRDFVQETSSIAQSFFSLCGTKAGHSAAGA